MLSIATLLTAFYAVDLESRDPRYQHDDPDYAAEVASARAELIAELDIIDPTPDYTDREHLDPDRIDAFIDSYNDWLASLATQKGA